ncbi:UbiA family prenyltransferase [Roseobacter sinensis]|uniref:UbiA family prenyltransferase n=1 Tax=Roseobacter sinensis TaxID=2931391 RepID=A0ABT3BJ86_9RHOB|nr:UbiA family prenyltransferase [Roseobacter sp. WL0113]MCV3273632.1 UbiA family prenyltransferase [Roseobacter sp. WL0113]
MSIKTHVESMSESEVPHLKDGPGDAVARERGAAVSRAELPALKQPRDIPLIVDLDGTLLRSDLLLETAFRRLGRDPGAIVGILRSLRRGKAALKQYLCAGTDCAPETLPYDASILSMIRLARLEGRPVYLASGSHEDMVKAVADHLGIFTGYFATTSSSSTNLSGVAKAERLVKEFGSKGFDYIGNGAADLPVWEQARQQIAVRTSRRVASKLRKIAPQAQFIDHDRASLRDWARQFRVHQYAKNALVFVPMIAAHAVTFENLFITMIAAAAFCLAASACYILNDLVDLQDDRAHRTKKERPLARGDIPLVHAMLAVPVLLTLAAVLSLSLSPVFAAVVASYFVISTAYSFSLKEILLVDVLTLAGLYTIRLIGGSVAVGVTLSTWLIVFALSIFVSLALMKRFVELTAYADADRAAPKNRDYEHIDRSMIAALSAAAGFNAVTVLALYVSGSSVTRLYSNPEFLLLACPVLTYWIGRALILAQRRQMQDDPVVFALKDPMSRLSGLAMLAVFVAAI